MLDMSRNSCVLPISAGMISGDPYGAADDDIDDLPTLPIPRPGEWSPMAAPREDLRIVPPALGGGGASFTAAGDGATGTPTDETSAAPAWTRTEHERRDSDRFTWELAARLTSGMLANPARSHSSVKDAMGLFDQFLQEMHSYTKIASEFDLMGSEAARRRSHEEYFQGQHSPNPSNPAVPLPDRSAPAPPNTTPRSEPSQPRPMGDYRPIPPGSRVPYAPGSMAGTPPPERQPGNGEQAA